MRASIVLAVAMSVCLFPALSGAQVPVSGKPVPALSFLDGTIQTYMTEHYVDAAVVGISYFGKTVYCRGFGWSDRDKQNPLQENATFRVASITKTFTAAVIMDLVDRELLDLEDHAFDLGQPGGGILDLVPFPPSDPIDPRLRNITVYHLLHHTGGWDRDLVTDPTNQELVIQNAMGLSELPTAEETMRWVSSQSRWGGWTCWLMCEPSS